MIPLKREIDQIAKDKGIDKKIIVDALKEAMVQAAHKKYGADKAIEPTYNDETGEVELFEFRTVVEVITDPETQVIVAKARELDPEVEIGDEIGVKLDTEGFGRILAQVAKQVIIQRVREAERGIVFDEYKDRKGEVVNGIVRRFEKGSLIVDLGRAEAVLPAKEQVQRESYRPGDRIRAYVADVNKEAKGPQIILSRASIELLNKLFESEVPEIYEGIVTIESAAREPGVRSKIAVASRDSDVDPVGACVGMKGSRVQSVVQELRGERIDIVPWSPDPARYVCSALSPAQVSKVIIDESAKSMDVIVPDDQLSLAIGRKGQNVRLAVQLTGWRIDIKSESKMREIAAWLAKAVSVVEGWGEPEAEILLNQGVTSLDDLSQQPVELLMQLPGIDEAGAKAVRQRAAELATEQRRLDSERVAQEAAAAAAAMAEAAAPAPAPAGATEGSKEFPLRAAPGAAYGTKMAKIRAYKIAEELGLDRNDLVERARSLGVEVPGPMASLDEDVAALLRERLGGHAPGAQVTERRVEAQGGAAVIRRRKRAPEPAPVPEPVAAPVAAVEPEITPEPEPIEEPTPVTEIHAEETAESPVAEAEAFAADAADLDPTPSVQAGAARPGEAPRHAPRGPTERPADLGAAPAAPGAGKERKRVREVVNLREQEQLAKQAVTRAVRRTTTIDPRVMQSPRKRKRDKGAPLRPAAAAPPKAGKRIVRAEGHISVAELAHQLGAKAAEVQGRLMALGIMASVNQQLDLESAGKVATQYGFEVHDVGFQEAEVIGQAAAEGDAAQLVVRPPIVTVMGHVDHGKTSLLDAIRKTKVVEGESGGITQHIGAYQAAVGDRRITFIDTPGHAAFTLMRARGAEVTDIVILVVAATEGIMPQTVEAINHAKAAEVPLIVAINKVDLPDANPQLARQRLMEHGLVPEDFGGDTICVNVSATKGTGLDQLLEMVLLQADVLELRADPTRRARGVVLEAELDKGRGPVATVLVQDGTLRPGDAVVVGTAFGRVRAMENENGQRVEAAGPSAPVQLIGLSSVPEAGQLMHAVESERDARDVAEHRAAEERQKPTQAKPKISLEELFARSDDDGPKELRIVLKADVHGSCEAVRDALLKLATDTVKVNVILSGVGAISEGDVMLAKASDAIVVGFHVRPDPAARRAAEGQGVDLRSYQIIYELTDEVRQAMAGLLPPKLEEKVLGRIEVRKTFNVPRIGTIAGCYVLDGMVRRNAKARLIRDGVQIWEGGFGSLKRFKDDVREVQTGFECGIGLDGYNDLKVGDIIEPYEIQETRATL